MNTEESKADRWFRIIRFAPKKLSFKLCEYLNLTLQQTQRKFPFLPARVCEMSTTCGETAVNQRQLTDSLLCIKDYFDTIHK